MAVRDYVVTVLSREAKTIRVELKLSGQTPWVGLFPAFIQGLLFPEDWDSDGPPNQDAYAAWAGKRDEEIEDGEFDAREEIVSVQVVEGGPEKAWPEEMPLGLEDEAAHAILGPPVVLEIKVERAGMLGHLKPGASWDCYRPDYYEENAIFRAGPHALRTWKRPAKPAKQKAPPPPVADTSTLARVTEQTDDSVVVELVTNGELPSLDLVRWCVLLSSPYPQLGKVHADYRTRLVKSVTLVSVDAATDEAANLLDARIPKPSAAERKKHGMPEWIRLRPPATCVYRVQANERAWLAEPSTYYPPTNWFQPMGDPLSRRPKPTPASELAEFRELLELAQMEGPAAAVDMLLEGLTGTFDVVHLALNEAQRIDAPIARLEGRLGPLIGSYDVATACAALAVAKRIASETLLGPVVLATWRIEHEVTSAATDALRAFSNLPAWAEKRLHVEPYLPPGMSAEDARAALQRGYGFHRPHPG